MWNNMFLKELTERLPLESKHLAATIYSNIHLPLDISISPNDSFPLRGAIGVLHLRHNIGIDSGRNPKGAN
jgi:hypothetical protein